jgi:hypothetical protein
MAERTLWSRRAGAGRTLAVVVALVAGLLAVGSGQPSSAAPATIGTRTGFAPTSWMLLWGTDAELDRDLDNVAASGAKWLRFDVDWQSTETAKGSYNWTAIDRVISRATARGLSVIGTIAYTPAWARPSGTSDKTPPSDPADFASFARAVAARYAPQGAHAWEIWNEPNIPMFWQPKPDVPAYTSMLKQAYAAIKSVDPAATVISAGLAPAGDSGDGRYVSPRTFISRMYDNGVKGSFDALGMHPYAYPYGITAVGDWNQYQSMPATYQLLVDRGDGDKKIWATEYGAPTGTASSAVSELVQAQFVVAATNDWLRRSWAGPLLWYGLRDSGTDPADPEQNFGLRRKDDSAKLAWAAWTAQMALPDPSGAVATTTTTAAPTTTTAISGGGGGGASGTAPGPSGGGTTGGGGATSTTPSPVGANVPSIPATTLPPAPGAHPTKAGAAQLRLGSRAVAVASTREGDGYWVASGTGEVAAIGSAPDLGSLGSQRLNQPIVGMAATPSGRGYWLVSRDGGIFAFGDARFQGSTGDLRLNRPIVGMSTTPSGNGYWLVASDGGIFAFGDARFQGSTGDVRLNQPVVGMATCPTGYWLVASDGGVFSYGCSFHGSTGDVRLNQPITAVTASSGGSGYWFTAADGGVFTFGNVGFHGSLGSNPPSGGVTGMASPADGSTYWVVSAAGTVYSCTSFCTR